MFYPPTEEKKDAEKRKEEGKSKVSCRVCSYRRVEEILNRDGRGKKRGKKKKKVSCGSFNGVLCETPEQTLV